MTGIRHLTRPIERQQNLHPRPEQATFPDDMLTLSEISKAFGPQTLFRKTTLQVNRQDRIGLVGPNGAGKSTLFNIILGKESPDDGKIMVERNVKIGFLPQESAPVQDETVLELAIRPELAQLQKQIKKLDANPDLHDDLDHSPHARYAELHGHQVEAKVKKILAGLSFREKDFDRPAREMSGGWVMRAHLARLLAEEPDLSRSDSGHFP
jgi:ATP-binding cassette subfamily F protein 3